VNSGGRGIGTAQLQSLIDWARGDPVVEKLCLFVHAANQTVIGLYKKMGFLEEGRRVRQVQIVD